MVVGLAANMSVGETVMDRRDTVGGGGLIMRLG